jgi:hypothetical protein
VVRYPSLHAGTVTYESQHVLRQLCIVPVYLSSLARQTPQIQTRAAHKNKIDCIVVPSGQRALVLMQFKLTICVQCRTNDSPGFSSSRRSGVISKRFLYWIHSMLAANLRVLCVICGLFSEREDSAMVTGQQSH